MSERRIFLLLAWSLLLAVFVWSVLPVLTPVVLFLALVYLLTPFFGTDLYRRMLEEQIDILGQAEGAKP